MASTLCQILLTIFCPKAQNFVWFGPYDFVQIPPACAPNTSNGNIKYPIGKPIFGVNLPLKLFCATVANADIGNLKSLHTFVEKCLYHMLVKLNKIVNYNEGLSLLTKKKQTNKQTNKRVFYTHF